MNLSVSEKSRTARVAAWSVAHSRLVVLVWVLLALAGGVAAAQAGPRLSFRFDLPGQKAYETNTAIVRGFGSGGVNPPLVAVVHLPAGSTADARQVRSDIVDLARRGAQALPGARVADVVDGAPGFVSADGATTFVYFYPVPDYTGSDPYAKALPALRSALASVRVGGAPVEVTGATVLAAGGSSSGNSVLIETILAGVAALVVLAIVFGSLLALLPLLIAAVAIPTAFVGIYALTYATTMSTLVQNIVALVGLGVAIDYALLVVTRWREERAAGRPNDEAVLVAAGTAGSSVVFSGITVTVSLAALALTSVPFLRSVGLAGLLVPLASVAVSTTLLPVILNAAGPRLEWPRRRPPNTVSRLWTGIARRVVAHRVAATVGSLVVVAVMVAPVAGLRLGQPEATAQAASAPAEARVGLDALVASGLGPGVLRPTEVLVPVGTRVPLVIGAGVADPGAWRTSTSRVIDFWTPADPSSARGKHDLAGIRAAAATMPGARVGGSPAQDGDFISALYGRNLWVIVAAIVIVTFLLLSRALHSVWLPIKALLLNAASLAAAFGVLTFVWQQGHLSGSLFHTPATGAITLWVPLAVFALLFGLSMDYEVFILTRINEEYEAGHDTGEAVVRGIGATGRLVSSGALILFLAFVALGGVPQTDVKILSTGLAAGIILDATVIRGVLAPALVALFGRLNWWVPAGLGRVLRIRPLVQGGAGGRSGADPVLPGAPEGAPDQLTP